MTNPQKLKQAISLISELDESRLDALLVLLRQPIEDYELSEEDENIVKERFEKYESGKGKTVSALGVSRRIKSKLKKGKR